MQLQFAIVSIIAFINIRLIKLNTKTKQKDNFNIISKRYNCFIKLLPLFKIKRLAYKILLISNKAI
jgi:hypothetical protein